MVCIIININSGFIIDKPRKLTLEARKPWHRITISLVPASCNMPTSLLPCLLGIMTFSCWNAEKIIQQFKHVFRSAVKRIDFEWIYSVKLIMAKCETNDLTKRRCWVLKSNKNWNVNSISRNDQTRA